MSSRVKVKVPEERTSHAVAHGDKRKYGERERERENFSLFFTAVSRLQHEALQRGAGRCHRSRLCVGLRPGSLKISGFTKLMPDSEMDNANSTTSAPSSPPTTMLQ